MKIKKVLFILFVLLISYSVVYAMFVSFSVIKLIPNAMILGPSGNLILPALCQGVTSDSLVGRDWVSLNISKNSIVKIVKAVISIRGPMTLDIVFNRGNIWFLTNGITADLKKSVVVNIPDNGVPVSAYWSGYW